MFPTFCLIFAGVKSVFINADDSGCEKRQQESEIIDCVATHVHCTCISSPFTKGLGISKLDIGGNILDSDFISYLFKNVCSLH